MMHLKIVLACLLLALCTGCGNGGPGSGAIIGPASNTYLYVSDAGNKTIAGFQVNTDAGALITLPGAPYVFNGTAPARLATDSQARFLFVADRDASNLSVYLIDPPTGILTPLSTTATPTTPRDVAVHPALNVVYVLCPAQIAAFRFDAITGASIPVPGSPFPVGTGVGTASGQRLAVDPSGTFLYVSNLIEILTYKIGSDGSLTLVSRFAQLGASFTGIAVDPVAARVYVASPASGVNQPGGVYGFSTDATGTLVPLAESPFNAGVGMRELTMDKAGTFVVAAGGATGAGVLSLLTVDATTGRLTLSRQSPYSSPPDPVQLTVDPLGRFVYSANANLSGSSLSGGNVSGFSIDSRTALLTPAIGSPFSMNVPTGVLSVRPVP